MRRLLFLLLFSIAGYAQTTTTVTGTIKDLSGSVVTSGQVTFQLQPGLDTTISGSARFSPSIVTCGITGAGAIKALDLVSACTVTYNTALIPQNSYYKVCIQANFVAGGACFNWYALVSSFDLTTAVPTPGTAPAFTFVDLITSQTISGNKTFSGANSFSGVNTFSGIPVFSAGIQGTTGQTLALPSSADTLAGAANTLTFTGKTFDTAGTGNSFLINGLAATANTGTGSVVRATSPALVTPALGVATATSIAVGGGTVINKILMTSATLTPGLIGANSEVDVTVTVTGAATTGIAFASPTTNLGSGNITWDAYVSAANTVIVRFNNVTAGGITPNAVTWNIAVIQ